MVFLRLNSQGNEVKQLQMKLIRLGVIVTVNGFFDKKTEKAVKKFQKQQNIKVDGIVGYYTSHKIDYLLNLRENEKNNDEFDWKIINKWI